MKLSDRYRYTLLCEDRQTKDFILNILKLQGISIRQIRVEMAQCGAGSGEAFVRREYPRRLAALRTYNYNRNALIICTDADTHTVEDRKRMLEEFCLNLLPAIQGRQQNEPVMIWVPKRAIENWIFFLGSQRTSVTEDDRYPHGGNPVRCRDEAETMSEYLQKIVELEDVLPSMADAKQEYDHLCEIQR